jgi:hypothetical protein
MIRTLATAIAVVLLYLAIVAMIQAKERAIDAEAWCRPPKAGERLIAWGSADGKPFCTYHTKFGYGEVPR